MSTPFKMRGFSGFGNSPAKWVQYIPMAIKAAQGIGKLFKKKEK